MDHYVKRLVKIVEDGIEQKVFPGAVVHVARSGNCVLYEAFGHAELVPNKRELQKDMIFDLASVTKVMAALPAVLRSVQLGKLDLDVPVARYLPQWKATAGGYTRANITVKHLLTHSSGLPGWRPYYLTLKNSGQYLEQICQEPLDYATGTKVLYSDLGLMLTGFILEQIWQKSLDELCDQLVFQPLGLDQTGYRPDYTRERYVATEVGNKLEMQMCHDYAQKCRSVLSSEREADGNSETSEFTFRITEEDIYSLSWRTETICGEVNDGNTFYGLSGISGHAGLFAPASDVARYLSMWANEGVIDGKEFLEPRLVRTAVANQTPGLNIARAIGFEAAPAESSSQFGASCSAGHAAAPGAFGHTGFTGTSIWFDPLSQTEVTVLTNRIHPEVKDGMLEWRRQFHTAAFQK